MAVYVAVRYHSVTTKSARNAQASYLARLRFSSAQRGPITNEEGQGRDATMSCLVCETHAQMEPNEVMRICAHSGVERFVWCDAVPKTDGQVDKLIRVLSKAQKAANLKKPGPKPKHTLITV